jgi:uncharacterized protein (TIGR03437 family)
MIRAGAALAWIALPLAAQVNVLTYQYDLARTGVNSHETILTPVNVNAGSFGKLFSDPVDGFIYGQPLYLANVAIPGQGTHNVVYVATEHDSVYALDADTRQQLWQVSFLDPEAGVTTVPFGEDVYNCDQIIPEIGITGTPVIDAAAGTIYVVAMTKENGTFVHRLHALDVTTRAERAGSPVTVQASYPGTGEGGSTVVFQPRNYKQRPGLLLLNGVVYTGWSSHCDAGTYHGWLIGYDAGTLQQVAVYNNTPNGSQASIWQGGAGPAADEAGNIYLAGGNGSFDYAMGGTDLGESYIKLTSAGGLAVEDYFTPFNFQYLNDNDTDVGSAGVVLLGDEAGSAAHPHLMFGVGKEGRYYLLDRDNMGHWQAGSDSQIVATTGAYANSGLFGNPAYFNHNVYLCSTGIPMTANTVYNALLSTGPASHNESAFDYPACVPSISANDTADGIVWATEPSPMLHAYDAGNLEIEYYNSGQNAARDAMGPYVKFTPPTVANGKVYVGTQSSLDVYGPLPGVTPPPLVVNMASGQPGLAAPGSIVSIRGEGLASGAESAPGYPLPPTLGGASVRINGVTAPLFYASPARLNVQVPFETATGPATVVVQSGGTQLTASLTIQPVAPGLFLGDPGRVMAGNPDGSINGPLQPAASGSEITLYLTGIGPVPGLTTGAAAPNLQLTNSIGVIVGDNGAQVVAAGPAAGFAGLYQVNLILPQLPPGDYPVQVIVDRVKSNTGVISLR